MMSLPPISPINPSIHRSQDDLDTLVEIICSLSLVDAVRLQTLLAEHGIEVTFSTPTVETYQIGESGAQEETSQPSTFRT